MVKNKLASLCYYSIFSELAVNLISIYIPIIIYNNFNKVSYAILYVFIAFFVQAIFNILFRKFLCSHATLCLLIRIVPVVGINLLINISILSPLFSVIVFGVCGAFVEALYNVPIAKILSDCIDGKEGKSVGYFKTSIVVGKIVAPIVGGYVLTALKNVVLNIICIAIYLVGFVFLIMCARHIKTSKIENSNIVYRNNKTYKSLYLKEYLKLFIINFAIGITAFGDKVLPLFAVIENLQMQSIGFVVAIFNFCDLVSNYVAGRISDLKVGYIISIVACFIYAVVWATVPLSNAVMLFVLSGVLGLCYPLFGVILQSRSLKQGFLFSKQEQILSMREFSQHLGASFIAVCSLCISNIGIVFYLIGISVLSICIILMANREFNL